MWASWWWVVSCCSERAPLDPPSFLAPVTETGLSQRQQSLIEQTRLALAGFGVPACRVWLSHRFHTPDEKVCWWMCRKDRPTLSAEKKNTSIERIRLVVRENLLQHVNLNVTCSSSDRFTKSLLTYLRFTSLVAVIVQVEILHVGEIFDVTLSFASSPCATWSWHTQKISVAEPTATQHSSSCHHRVISGISSGIKRNRQQFSVDNVCGKRCNKRLTYGERTLAAVV